jgi:hypothetical protein
MSNISAIYNTNPLAAITFLQMEICALQQSGGDNFDRLQFVVGDDTSIVYTNNEDLLTLPTNGEYTLVIALPDIITGSFFISADGVPLPYGRSDRESYTLDFSNPNQLTITKLNIPFQNGQLYVINYAY